MSDIQRSDVIATTYERMEWKMWNYLLDVSKIKQVIKNIQECDAISKKWSQIDAEKKQAIFKIHCPVRFQGNYISRTLETDLANFLLKLQGKSRFCDQD
jgi:hypothetical protein